MQRVTAKEARYIKLGRSGCWEGLCLADGTLRLGYYEVPHELAQTGDLEALRAYFRRGGCTSQVASSHAKQVLDFYRAGPETLWITFSDGHLWWARADGPVEFLGGSEAEMDARGSRLRCTRDGWQKTSLGGRPLRVSELNGALTKTAAYRMTICAVEPFDYLVRKINDEDLPEVARAKGARNGALDSIRDLMRLLTWRDFELLVELIFSQSGWRRTGETGGTQETVDIELELPSTGERAFVQVKSRTDQGQLQDYMARLADRPESKMFYVYHTARTPLRAAGGGVVLVGPERLAEMVLTSGLFDWLLKKAG